MSILTMILIALVLSCIYYITIVTFPDNYKNTIMKRKINNLIFCSIVFYVVLIIILYFTYDLYKDCIVIEEKYSLLIIPAILVILFTTNIYYPSAKMIIVEIQKEKVVIDKLLEFIFSYRFDDVSERDSIILSLNDLKETNKDIFTFHGINILIDLLLKQSTSLTKKAPENVISSLENYCLKIKQELNETSGAPFSNISIITSFSFSTILTLLLTYFSIL